MPFEVFRSVFEVFRGVPRPRSASEQPRPRRYCLECLSLGLRGVARRSKHLKAFQPLTAAKAALPPLLPGMLKSASSRPP